MFDATQKAKLFLLKASGKLVSMAELKDLAKAAGYAWRGSSGPSSGNPELDVVFDGPLAERQAKYTPPALTFTLKAHCGRPGCGQLHEGWANYTEAKENDAPLESQCKAGHISYSDSGEAEGEPANLYSLTDWTEA